MCPPPLLHSAALARAARRVGDRLFALSGFGMFNQRPGACCWRSGRGPLRQTDGLAVLPVVL